MGVFHLIMVYMHILSKRFADGGLRDALIQSAIIAEGSVDRALCGKMYNRGIRMYKLMYEVLMRILIQQIEEENIAVDINGSINEAETTTVTGESVEWVMRSEDFQAVYDNFIDLKLKMSNDGKTLQAFWISYIEMVDLLLNTIYSVRSGKWELLLECIRDIIPFAFAYDNLNYARYLTGMLGDMLALPTDFPEIYQEFIQGNFAAQLSNNKFSKSETDKVIETTINKDTKTSGGTTGFSTNVNAVKRWELNASYRAAIRKCFHDHLHYQPQRSIHADLTSFRITKDEADIQSLLTTLTTLFINPFSSQPLLSFSTGILATDDVSHDMATAKERGKIAMDVFVDQRLSPEAEKSFFDPIKKQKLKTFTTMSKIKTFKVKDKTIPLKASSEIFSKIAIIAQKRSVDLKTVFCYPLGPLPWSLADAMGTLKKTSKAALMHKLEGKIEPTEQIEGDYAMIIDGMAYVQQANVKNITYAEFATNLLQTILTISKNAKRIDVVFDVYKEQSIKNIERGRRSRGELSFQKILPTTEIKQWSQFLSSIKNKNELIIFINDQWKLKTNSHRIGSRKLYVTCGQDVTLITNSIFLLQHDLASDQEEADTRMFVHAHHATSSFNKVMISSPDTDVFVIALAKSLEIDANLFMLTGVKSKRRIIDINAVANGLCNTIPASSSREEFLSSLVGLHCLTGCDTVSAFAGKGKLKPFNLMVKQSDYITTFSGLGNDEFVDDVLLKKIEMFVCHLYGNKKCSSINQLRYQLYCQGGGKMPCELLPPCDNVLQLHVERANYQARIWKNSLHPMFNVLDPVGHGWCLDDEGKIDINWMDCKPAPEEVKLYNFQFLK